MDLKSYRSKPKSEPNPDVGTDVKNLMRLHSWIFELQKSGKLPHTLSFTDIVRGSVELPEAVLAMKPSDVDLLGARESCRSTKRAPSEAGVHPKVSFIESIKIANLKFVLSPTFDFALIVNDDT